MELLGDKTEAHMLVRFDKNGEHQDKWMPYDYTTTSAGNGQPLALRCAAKDSLSTYMKTRGQPGSFEELLPRQVACALHIPTAHPLHASARHSPPATPLRTASHTPHHLLSPIWPFVHLGGPSHRGHRCRTELHRLRNA